MSSSLPDDINALKRLLAEQEALNRALQEKLNERERELYWEGQRRTDLIRFGLFTGGTYLWEWKNNAENGASTNERYNLYPIPQTDMQANGGLTQNPGY